MCVAQGAVITYATRATSLNSRGLISVMRSMAVIAAHLSDVSVSPPVIPLWLPVLVYCGV